MTALRAELTGSDIATAEGLEVKAESPVLGLCRALIEAGYDPATPLNVYRGDTLALRVKSIDGGAQLRMGVSATGVPVFKRRETSPTAPPIAANQLDGATTTSAQEIA